MLCGWRSVEREGVPYTKWSSFERVSHSVVVVVIPASKAITFFLRTLLVSSKLDSVPLSAREKEDVSCLLGRQCRTHLQCLCNIVLRHATHPHRLLREPIFEVREVHLLSNVLGPSMLLEGLKHHSIDLGREILCLRSSNVPARR